MSNKKISITGLGYVGLPLAVAFAENGIDVVGYDTDINKITLYKKGIDATLEVGDERLKRIIDTGKITFTSDPSVFKSCDFNIIAVPTPINIDRTPDLSMVVEASETIGQNIKAGSYVVYESTVYPGVTEEICIPILEKESSLKCGRDFKVGYSPERINPGDKVHVLSNVVKVVSGIDEESLDTIDKVYSIIAKKGVYRAVSIRVAEAAKVIENAQRDINIAFMNELALIFDRLNLDTKSVLEAAETKWNFLKFRPGLVGGHCIGVDPYYLTYKAELVGYKPEVILAGRRINDSMGAIIAQRTIKLMIQAGISIKGARIGVLGLTFKENCPDTRNSKVFDIIKELLEYGVEIIATDPLAENNLTEYKHGIKNNMIEDIKDVDALIIAVAHDEYLSLNLESISHYYAKGVSKKVLMDVKGIINGHDVREDYLYWRL